jgi:maleate isomerase
MTRPAAAQAPRIVSEFDGELEFDAPGRPVRLGLIALATDLTIERDARRLLPQDDVALHVTRVPFANPTTPENLRAMAPKLADAAALLLPEIPLAAICYGCTSASVAIGDAEVARYIGQARPGVPVVTPILAAAQAFRALGAARISVLTPYLPETTAPMLDYFDAAGIAVARCSCLGLPDDRDMARLSARTILAAARDADTPEAEALFLSCTALPAVPLIAALEAELGKPVITSNQASFWAMLRLAGLPVPADFGRIHAFGEKVRHA